MAQAQELSQTGQLYIPLSTFLQNWLHAPPSEGSVELAFQLLRLSPRSTLGEPGVSAKVRDFEAKMPPIFAPVQRLYGNPKHRRN